MFHSLTNLSHEMLLLILPFGCGYLCDDDGEPCEKSLQAAVALQAIIALETPHKAKLTEIN